MADFDVNTITVQGAIAIASATAGDKLVIDGCDATTDVLTQAQAVQIATRPVSPASTTDTIGLAGSTDNHVYAYASFIRGESTGGDVNSFLLYGHMESDATTVFVVAVASAAAPTHIPTSSDVTNRVEIQFELTFSATDEVVTVTDTSMYTTRGEFLILKNRTVTTHAEGQATVGEDQTVYGKKEFMDDMIFNGMYQVQAKVIEGQNTQNMFAFTQNGDRQTLGPMITATTTYNGTSYVSSTTSLSATAILGIAGGAGFSAEHKNVGDSNATIMATRGLSNASAGVVVEPTQVTLYTQAAGSNARRTLSYTGGQLTGSFDTISTSNNELDIYVRASDADIDMYFDATTPDSTWSVGLTNANDDKTATLKFYAGADSGGHLTCVSATGGVSKLGTNATPWGEAHIEEGYLDHLHLPNIDLGYDDNVDGLLINAGIFPSSSGAYDLGSVAKMWGDIHARSTYAGSVYTYGLNSAESELNIDVYSLNGGGYNAYHSSIYMYCDDPSYPGINLLLKASGESEVKYTFYPDCFLGNGKKLGTDSNRWSDVYANNLHGKLPSVEGQTEPNVGAIFFAGIEVSGTFSVGCGQTAKVGSPLFQGGSNVTAIGPARWDREANGFIAYTPFNTNTGTYKLLCGSSKQSSNTACYALVMRIE